MWYQKLIVYWYNSDVMRYHISKIIFILRTILELYCLPIVNALLWENSRCVPCLMHGERKIKKRNNIRFPLLTLLHAGYRILKLYTIYYNIVSKHHTWCTSCHPCKSVAPMLAWSCNNVSHNNGSVLFVTDKYKGVNPLPSL